MKNVLRWCALACWLLVMAAKTGFAQEPENPFHLRSWKDIAEGKIMYQVFCLRCHGGKAEGGEGPSLVDDIWLHGGTDPEVFRTVTEGVPANGMESFGGKLEEIEIWRIITYLKSLAAGRSEDAEADRAQEQAGARSLLTRVVSEDENLPFDPRWAPPLSGNPNFGKSLFYSGLGPANCSRCHMVNGDGGDIGPDLSAIARDRTPAETLNSILNPHDDITEGYASMMVVTKDGIFITGVLKEDTEDILRIGDINGTIFTVEKSNIDRMSDVETSSMPGNFQDILSLQEFYDMLAYLRTLK